MPPRGNWQSFRYGVGIREAMTEAEPRERLEEMPENSADFRSLNRRQLQTEGEGGRQLRTISNPCKPSPVITSPVCLQGLL